MVTVVVSMVVASCQRVWPELSLNLTKRHLQWADENEALWTGDEEQ
jgi:hypothetical protein